MRALLLALALLAACPALGSRTLVGAALPTVPSAPTAVPAGPAEPDVDACLVSFTAWWGWDCSTVAACCPALKALGEPCLARVLESVAPESLPAV